MMFVPMDKIPPPVSLPWLQRHPGDLCRAREVELVEAESKSQPLGLGDLEVWDKSESNWDLHGDL